MMMMKKLLMIFKKRNKDISVESSVENMSERPYMAETDDMDADYNKFIWDISADLKDDKDIKSLINRYEGQISRQKKDQGFSFLKYLTAFWVTPAVTIAAVCTIIIFNFPAHNIQETLSYHTAVGEQKTITLADKSTITLNTNTALKVIFNENFRTIHLVKGEAIFTVAKNPERPFMVHTGSGIVQAIGTEFNIYINETDPQKVIVTVLEGKIMIKDEENNSQKVILPLLKSGQKITLAALLNEQDILKSDISNMASWRSGKVIFQDITLQQAVLNHNRYSKTKIIIEDQSLGARKISGTFKLGDTEALIFAFKNLLEVDVHKRYQKLLITPKEM